MENIIQGYKTDDDYRRISIRSVGVSIFREEGGYGGVSKLWLLILLALHLIPKLHCFSHLYITKHFFFVFSLLRSSDEISICRLSSQWVPIKVKYPSPMDKSCVD